MINEIEKKAITDERASPTTEVGKNGRFHDKGFKRDQNTGCYTYLVYRYQPDSTREKIGLRNTNCRLKLMYGDEYGLHIESLAGKGTVVLIHIPAQTREKGRDDTCTG